MKVTFEIDDVYVEMLEDCSKTKFSSEFSRSGLIRYAIKYFLSKMDYTAAQDLSEGELRTLHLKENQRWIRREKKE